MKKGLLIVIEGIDGSGKTTQVNLFTKKLKEQNIPFEVISFPRYEDNIYGKLIQRYLEGEFGSIDKVNPYLMALVYAGDRSLVKPLIEKWLLDGKIVIANRYASSSKAHLGANLSSEKKEEFFRWLDVLEYETNKIPKEDLTILLKVDSKTGQENTFDKQKPDLHEQNITHLEKASKIYLELAEKQRNWEIINCMEGGQIKPAEKINQEIMKIFQDFTN